MAMPANEDLYFEDPYVRSDDEETITSDHGRDSRGSDHDDKSGLVTPALVRQASLGRRTKPSLMTIRSVDNSSIKRKQSPDSKEWEAGIGGAVLAAKDGLGPARLRELSPDDASLDSPTDLRYRDPEKDMDPEKDGSLGGSAFRLQHPARAAGFADRPGRPRPPRLDVDAVREAEARGSLTSLPELIRRATRLAANLDRGKTASRLGLDFWEMGAPDRKNSHMSNTMGDMLAAFPPPGEGTPVRGGTPKDQRRMSKWPSVGEYGADGASSGKEKRRRRCCGMPLWTFVTLLIVLLFLVAAAVIIPIVLVVIPKMNKSTGTAAQDTQGSGNGNGNAAPTVPSASPTGPTDNQNGQCSGIITCQNGGVAIPNADRSCNCVCINGFTGKTCATRGDSGCTTTSIGGTANNATVGSGIPRLIDSAENDFKIPLDSTRLLSLFSSLSMSCTAENALITFNGLASRSDKNAYMSLLIDTSTSSSPSLPLLSDPHPSPLALHPRQAIGNPGNANEKPSSPSSTTPAVKAAATPTTPISSDPTALDFARLGVLLSLQVSGKLDTAATAQESIQNFLSNDRNGASNGGSKTTTVDLDVFTIDLVQLSIKFDNGTTIQAATPSSTN